MGRLFLLGEGSPLRVDPKILLLPLVVVTSLSLPEHWRFDLSPVSLLLDSSSLNRSFFSLGVLGIDVYLILPYTLSLVALEHVGAVLVLAVHCLHVEQTLLDETLLDEIHT